MSDLSIGAGERLLSRAAAFVHRHPRKITALVAALMFGGGGGAFAVASFAPEPAGRQGQPHPGGGRARRAHLSAGGRGLTALRLYFHVLGSARLGFGFGFGFSSSALRRFALGPSPSASAFTFRSLRRFRSAGCAGYSENSSPALRGGATPRWRNAASVAMRPRGVRCR